MPPEVTMSEKKTRRKFGAGFKADAVRLVHGRLLDERVDDAQGCIAAMRLEMSRCNLRVWKRSRIPQRREALFEPEAA
jgi:hypothetical protein